MAPFKPAVPLAMWLQLPPETCLLFSQPIPGLILTALKKLACVLDPPGPTGGNWTTLSPHVQAFSLSGLPLGVGLGLSWMAWDEQSSNGR